MGACGAFQVARTEVRGGMLCVRACRRAPPAVCMPKRPRIRSARAGQRPAPRHHQGEGPTAKSGRDGALARARDTVKCCQNPGQVKSEPRSDRIRTGGQMNRNPQLKAYFFKNKAYENIRAGLPLRILVGHKGIGKSALLRMSFLEDRDENVLSVWLQPNDLVVESATNQTFVEKIESYKRLINSTIYNSSLEKLGIVSEEKDKFNIQSTAKHLVSALYKKAVDAAGADVNDETIKLRKRFTRDRIVRVYIDDIDRGWSASREDINNISALINAARDLTNEEDSSIQIRIGLRSDAYYLYRTSDESTDKVEGNVVRLTWERHDILVVMALRVANYMGKSIDAREFETRTQGTIAQELHPVIEERFSVGRGHWDRAPIQIVLLSLNRNRPRDLIKLLTEAAREAYKQGHEKILASDLEEVFSNYSHGRITDLVLEFKSELPNIEPLLYNMKPTTRRSRNKDKRWVYTNGELLTKIGNIMESHRFSFTSQTVVTPKALAEFLYKIDFVIARDERPELEKPKWIHYDQNRMLQSQFVDFGYKWEVHPAYRWALQPKSVHDLLDEIEYL